MYCDQSSLLTRDPGCGVNKRKPHRWVIYSISRKCILYKDDKRLPKRLLFAERLEGGQDPGPGQPAQHWQKSLRDDFKAFGALHGSTPSDRRTFGVDRLVWTEAARKGEGAPWYTGVLLGAERFMASWHKSEEEASKLREVNRAA